MMQNPTQRQLTQQIQPVAYDTPAVKDELVYIVISNVTVQPPISASFGVYFYNKTGSQLCNQQLSIQGDEYDAWGTDDKYLITIACKKLNLTPVS